MDAVDLMFLRKYIPFIRYLLQNGEQNVKFKEMMEWIDSNKRFRRKIAELIEESLRVRYTRMLTNKSLPKWIHDLFQDKIEHIDLDSSDEDKDIVIVEDRSPRLLKQTTNNSQTSGEKGIIEIIDENTDECKKAQINTNENQEEIVCKKSYVLLKKLSPKFLEKYKINYNTENNNSTSLNVELVEGQKETHGDLSKAAKTESKRASSQIFHLNTDSDMTEQNTMICIICYSKPQNLTNHFVRVHKVESYVSRLTEETLNELHNNLRLAHPVEHDPKRSYYTVTCVFCENTVKDLFVNFYNHFSSHTGEYGFYCSYCKLKKPYRNEMLAHIKRSKTCNSAKILTSYVYNDQHTVIYLFRCKLCNFVQLNAANIQKHIFDHHGSHYDSSSIDRYIIAATDSPKQIKVVSDISEPENSVESTAFLSINEDEDKITTFNAAVEETLAPHEAVLDEDYFTPLMLSADDLKIEVED